jgi:dihydroorotate dehydrogenase (NAD+) catalytic subunit
MYRMRATQLPCYDRSQTYAWNYAHAPEPIAPEELKTGIPLFPGKWDFCGLPVGSPLGIPAGPLLNGKWCLYYASLGFDVLTYKTVRSRERACYPLPNLQPVKCGQLTGCEKELPATNDTTGSWAVSFGMPSQPPDVWRKDVENTRRALPAGKLLVVSVVGSVQPDWSLDDLAADYAACARWAVESGADCVEANFSCPNVSTCDGQLYQHPADAALVAARVREATGRVPFIVKVGRLAARKEAAALLEALAPHVDALAMTNSIAATVRSDRDDSLLFDGQPRGICGDATREASLAQTRQMSELIQERGFRTLLIGVGGASTARHVRDYLSAGAHAVHLATSAMLEPGVAIRIRTEWGETPSQSPSHDERHLVRN